MKNLIEEYLLEIKREKRQKQRQKYRERKKAEKKLEQIIRRTVEDEEFALQFLQYNPMEALAYFYKEIMDDRDRNNRKVDD